MSKYKLTDNTKILNNRTLYQIQAIKDFGNIKSGELGGWIEKEVNLDQYDNCWVYGNAEVYGNAKVYDIAEVYGNAKVYGMAAVYGIAEVYGDSKVYGIAEVYGNAKVYGMAAVYGDAKVYGNAVVYGDAKVCGTIVGNANVYNTIPYINRSDGYLFTIFKEFDGSVKITAGCRHFTLDEARDHWLKTRGGTPLGEETMIILECLEKIHKLYNKD